MVRHRVSSLRAVAASCAGLAGTGQSFATLRLSTRSVAATVRPSGLTASALLGELICRTATAPPVATLHKRAVLSSAQLRIQRLSPLKATPLTAPLWPLRGFI